MAFFDSYGRPEETEASAWRPLYEGWHIGALRLERHRLGNEVGVDDSLPGGGRGAGRTDVTTGMRKGRRPARGRATSWLRAPSSGAGVGGHRTGQ
ncbi:hypothetical protein ACWGIU_01840 [Streptomyces sp. NPDC054840]